MASIRYLVYDLRTSLKQQYDDADINVNTVLYWTLVHADRLKSQHIPKYDSEMFTATYDVGVLKDTRGRKYFELPKNVYDFDKDRGIKYISYHYTFDDCMPPFQSVTFSRTTAASARILRWTKEEYPTPSNPYFYRIGHDIFLLGIESIDVPQLEVGLLQTFNPASPGDLDMEFDFPQELIPVLQRQVLDMGRFVLSMPYERINDGTGEKQQQVPKTKLISVNEQQQQQPDENV